MISCIRLSAFLLAFSVHLDAQTPDTIAPATHFDFWAGTWDATWNEPGGQTGRGTNTITKTLDGRVLQEQFRILEGASKGFKGTSISVYQPRFKRWKQAWADNQGGYYDFTGRKEGDRRFFQTEVTELTDGRKLTQRMVFYDITEEAMTWDWEISYDAGETWALQWRINYTRKKR
jgi:hypothetical protein